ncbi:MULTISPECIES: hypothetical protein [unclassified Ensifer]|uniref:hypothetical protein n=1 Tax=unclassified Ensifer TaxID=2633371 RepID=UPI000813AED8|nr:MULTISPECIES: hypothetical protein [unclassified Ensifer]OCP18742.1 hypothetical protein BC363_31770 [Ensifer sp. LC384]OCP19745.1 hypothetical protein BC361_29940 [Ensifer sp. LC54]
MNHRLLLAAPLLFCVLSTTALAASATKDAPVALADVQNFGSPFSDLIAGYVVSFDKEAGTFRIRTSGAHEIAVQLGSFVYGEKVRNLGESFVSPGADWSKTLTPGRYVYVYGISYPDANKAGAQLEAKRIVFPSDGNGKFEAV